MWGKTAKAPGIHYQAIEKWGAALDPGEGVDTTLVNGVRVHCDLGDEVQRKMFYLGLYEPIQCFVVTRLLKSGMVVVDGGANVGQYSLLAATIVAPSGTVHAFEPVPTTYARLAAHMAANNLSNVILNQRALWKESTSLELSLPADHAHNIGAYSVTAGGGAMQSVSAAAITLDDYVKESGIERVDFIKLDIEGAEPEALEGMKESLMRWHPLVFMEVSSTTLQRSGHSPQAVVSFLEGFGYQSWAIKSDNHVPLSVRAGMEENVLFFVGDRPPALDAPVNVKSAMRWALGGRWR